ncbi:alpha/beta fold hydrolase [Streptomyces sp. NPDC005426]|uniref:alpha/beta fold hydrolase n=1 Tax=Streptomyces sp. NPDC005426 TaxID=3155344 RepID=UPI0033AE5DF8
MLPDLDIGSFQYALVDLRGYGEARDASGTYTTAEGAADVLALADRLGWDRFSLIGHSMGGSVVQRTGGRAAAGAQGRRGVTGPRVRPAPAARAVGAVRRRGAEPGQPPGHHRHHHRRRTPGCLAGSHGAPFGRVQRRDGVPGLAGFVGGRGLPRPGRRFAGPRPGGGGRTRPGPLR